MRIRVRMRVTVRVESGLGSPPQVLSVVTEMAAAGKPKKYGWADLKYDIKSQFFKARSHT